MQKELHKKIIVTGAAGFVGSNLIKELIKRYPEVEILAMDNFSTGSESNLDGIHHKGLTVVNVDLSSRSEVNSLKILLPKQFEEFTLCYHFAASIGVKEIHNNPGKSLRNSMDITNNLIDIFEQYNIKVIYSSTSETYGESELGGSSENDNLSILPTSSARSTYASSKLFTEHLLRSYSFECCIVRFFNIVGQDQKHNYGHVIPNFIKNAKNNEPLIVHDDGQSLRSYCYIDDAVNMLIALAFIDVDYKPVYNIGNSINVISSISLADMIIALTGSKSEVVFKDFKDIYPNGDQIVERFPNCTEINNLLIYLEMNNRPTRITNLLHKII